MKHKSPETRQRNKLIELRHRIWAIASHLRNTSEAPAAEALCNDCAELDSITALMEKKGQANGKHIKAAWNKLIRVHARMCDTGQHLDNTRQTHHGAALLEDCREIDGVIHAMDRRPQVIGAGAGTERGGPVPPKENE